jgi:hypothetical protein
MQSSSSRQVAIRRIHCLDIVMFATPVTLASKVPVDLTSLKQSREQWKVKTTLRLSILSHFYSPQTQCNIQRSKVRCFLNANRHELFPNMLASIAELDITIYCFRLFGVLCQRRFTGALKPLFRHSTLTRLSGFALHTYSFMLLSPRRLIIAYASDPNQTRCIL